MTYKSTNMLARSYSYMIVLSKNVSPIYIYIYISLNYLTVQNTCKNSETLIHFNRSNRNRKSWNAKPDTESLWLHDQKLAITLSLWQNTAFRVTLISNKQVDCYCFFQSYLNSTGKSLRRKIDWLVVTRK